MLLTKYQVFQKTELFCEIIGRMVMTAFLGLCYTLFSKLYTNTKWSESISHILVLLLLLLLKKSYNGWIREKQK